MSEGKDIVNNSYLLIGASFIFYTACMIFRSKNQVMRSNFFILYATYVTDLAFYLVFLFLIRAIFPADYCAKEFLTVYKFFIFILFSAPMVGYVLQLLMIYNRYRLVIKHQIVNNTFKKKNCIQMIVAIAPAFILMIPVFANDSMEYDEETQTVTGFKGWYCMYIYLVEIVAGLVSLIIAIGLNAQIVNRIREDRISLNSYIVYCFVQLIYYIPLIFFFITRYIGKACDLEWLIKTSDIIHASCPIICTLLAMAVLIFSGEMRRVLIWKNPDVCACAVKPFKEERRF